MSITPPAYALRKFLRFALFLFALCLTSPATAQQGPPGGSPPRWKITYERSGSTTWSVSTTDSNGVPSISTGSTDWSTSSFGGSGYPQLWRGPGKSNMKGNGTIKAKLQWVDGSGQPASNPPEYVNLRETSSASSGSSTPQDYVTYKGSVDNGIESPNKTEFSSRSRRFETLKTTGGRRRRR